LGEGINTGRGRTERRNQEDSRITVKGGKGVQGKKNIGGNRRHSTGIVVRKRNIRGDKRGSARSEKKKGKEIVALEKEEGFATAAHSKKERGRWNSFETFIAGFRSTQKKEPESRTEKNKICPF